MENEFWLAGEPNKHDSGIWYDHDPGVDVIYGKPFHRYHVIEKSAYAALKAENEQLRLQFKRADLFGLEAILESEQLFKRSCEKLKVENDLLEAERDAYARAMAIALEHGIFPHKSEVKATIDNVLKKARK